VSRAEPIDCRRFTGYKPCAPGKLCEGCAEREPRGTRVLVVNLDALGAVIQATALLPAMRRAWPDAEISWVTLAGNIPALEGNPHLARVMPYDFETVSILGALRFDVAVNLDKTGRSAALLELVRAPEKRGFGLSGAGAIRPANEGARELYRLGLDDEFKFRGNAKPGTRLLTEAAGLEWKRDPYVLALADRELEFVRAYRAAHGLEKHYAVGFNTGASGVLPHKKLTEEQWVELVRRVGGEVESARVLLLGGRAETERNARIAEAAGVPVIQTPTTEGLRRGIGYVAACDAVVTGDTSAMHMAIALERWTVAWFGPTCAQEIDLYDLGVKVVSGEPCAPCWKRVCDHDAACLKSAALDAIVEGVRAGRGKASSL